MRHLLGVVTKSFGWVLMSIMLLGMQAGVAYAFPNWQCDSLAGTLTYEDGNGGIEYVAHEEFETVFFSSITTPMPEGYNSGDNANIDAEVTPPTFAGNGDYRLAEGSVGVNAGDNTYITNRATWITYQPGVYDIPLNSDVDISGVSPRVQGGAVDIGAYENTDPSDSDSVIYVSDAAGDDANDGTSWATAKKTIQGGIDAVADGGNVIVTNGTYAPFISYGRRITVESVGGAEKTIVDGGGTNRCATLISQNTFDEMDYETDISYTNTVVIGFTLENGYSEDGDGQIGNESQAHGGGVLCGAVYDCVIRNNECFGGGGAAFSDMYNCIISNNTGFIAGAIGYPVRNEEYFNVKLSIAENCKFIDNTVTEFGIETGVAVYYQLRRCLVRDNTATLLLLSMSSLDGCDVVENNGGVIVFACFANNTLVARNTCTVAMLEENAVAIAGAELRNCTVVGNASTEPGKLVAVYNAAVYNSIVYGNDGIEYIAGFDEEFGEGGVTFYNSITTPMPADDNAGDAANIDAAPIFAGMADYRLASNSVGVDAGNADYIVDTATLFYLGRGVSCVGMPLNPAIDASGSERIQNGTVNIGAYENLVYDTIYVSDADGDDADNGSTWATAKKTIQGGIHAVANGGSVIVTNGTYGAFNSYGRSITIESVEGAENTIVDAKRMSRAATLMSQEMWSTVNNRESCLSVTNTAVRGFTFENGYACPDDGDVGNLENRSYGGGVLGGTLVDCILRNNEAGGSYGFGGGVAYSHMYGCIISNNTATVIGAAHGSLYCLESVAEGCTFSNNVSTEEGADISTILAYILRNCVVENNTANLTLYVCVVDSCKVVDNTGLALAVCFANNTLVLRNNGNYSDGFPFSCSAVFASELRNCTVAANTYDAERYPTGMAVVFSKVYNSIIYGNDGENYHSESAELHNSITTPLPEGDADGGENIDTPPTFAGADDYRLLADSVGVDNGNNAYLLSETLDLLEMVPAGIPLNSTVDLKGSERIQNGVVNIGAYEDTVPSKGDDRLVIPGMDGERGTADDITLTDVLPEGGHYYVITADSTALGGEDGDVVIVTEFGPVLDMPAGTIVATNGVIIIGGTIQPNGTVHVAVDGEVWFYMPPAKRIAKGPGIYDPQGPTFTVDPDGPVVPIPLDERPVTITSIEVTDEQVILGWDVPILLDDGEIPHQHIIYAKASLTDAKWAVLGDLALNNTDPQLANTTYVPMALKDENEESYRFFYKTVRIAREQ